MIFFYILGILQYFMGYFEIILCFTILQKLYNEKKSRFNQIVINMISGIIAVIVGANRNFRLYSIILIIFMIITISITFWLLYREKLWQTFLYTALFCFSLALLDMLIIFIMGSVLKKSDLGAAIGRTICGKRIFVLCLARFILFLLYSYVLHLKKLIFGTFLKPIALILIAEIIGVCYFQSIYAGRPIPELAKDYFIYVIIVILITISFGIYSIYRNALEESNIVKLRINMLEQNYEDLKLYYNDSRTLFHDCKAHISLIRKYLENGQIEKAVTYIDNIYSPFSELEKKVCTGNEAVDLILNYKLSEIDEKSIEINYDLSLAESLMSDIEEGDIFVILYNLLDNAIEACEKVPNGQRWIYLSLRQVNEMLMINIQNSFQVQPIYKKGELLTLKNDKHLHGLGMRSVKKIVLKYKGRIEYKAQQNVFDVSITFF